MQGVLACCIMAAGTRGRPTAELAPGDKLRLTIGCDPRGLGRHGTPPASCAGVCASAQRSPETQSKWVLLKVGREPPESRTSSFSGLLALQAGPSGCRARIGRVYGFLSQAG